jgi:hypothetical protein
MCPLRMERHERHDEGSRGISTEESIPLYEQNPLADRSRTQGCSKARGSSTHDEHIRFCAYRCGSRWKCDRLWRWRSR